MRILLAAALVTTAPLAAQSMPQATPSVTPATAAKFTLDTPIETLRADPAAKALVDAALPELGAHAMYDSFKTMSLNQLAPMSGGKISDEILAKLGAQLAAVK